MTNKKPVIPDAKSRTGVAISESAILSPENTPEILTSVGGLVTNKSKKKILKKNIEHNGGDGTRGRPITAAFCLESMRASSPTRIKSETSPQESDDPNPRIKPQQPKLPSALKKFDEITAASKGKQIVMFLDYDGTLSPIVEDPDRAFMTNEMRAAVKNTARYFPTAIVSGRCRDKVYNFVKLAEMIYAGSHGMDIQGPTKGYRYKKGNEAVFFQPASEHLPMIDEVHETLSDITKSITGAKVENNKFCVSVHFRCVDEKNWAALSEKVAPVVNKYPKLILTFGRKVLEIRPNIEWDKGKAVEFLLESLGYENRTDVLPVYIGDDRTDEDAFKVLESRGLGFGILVSKFPKDTSASYSLQEPSEVEEFLCRLVEWKKMGTGGDQGNIRCNI